MSQKKTDFEQLIIDYCLEEGILREKIPDDPKLEFAYYIEYPPGTPRPQKIVVLKIKDKKFINIQVGIQISPIHLEQLEKRGNNAKLVFFEMLKRTMMNKNLLFNIDVKNNRFLIIDRIYRDGLNMDSFYRTIRKVFNMVLISNYMISDIAGGAKVIRTSDKDSDLTKTDEFSKDSFYT